jgi:hypothetical protein
MPAKPISGYISVIGTSYIYPIVDLISKARKNNPKQPNEVQTSNIDNGYSTAIIILSVLLLESTINRMQVINNHSYKKPLVYLRSQFPEKKQLLDELEELFVI